MTRNRCRALVFVLQLLAASVPAVAAAADLVQPLATPANPPVMVVHGTIRIVSTGRFTDATTRALSNTTLAAGDNHVCALAADGEILCWGRGTSGQLGDGSNADSNVPVTAAGILDATQLAAGGDSSCALLADGSVHCWGRGLEGQLGNGGNAAASTPVTVSGVTAAVAVVVAFRHACALLAGGGVRCWGTNFLGQLGNGSTTDSPVAVAVSGISTAVSIAAGGGDTCALLAGGTIRCWGDNDAGILGNGGVSPIPVDIAGISDAVAIAVGFDHACALIAGGTLRCWGRGGEGQLGDGRFEGSSTPVTVATGGLGRAIALATGRLHTCAIFEGGPPPSTGAMNCWGRNLNGQIGNGMTSGVDVGSPAQVVQSNFPIIAIAGGFEHTCAVFSDGNTKCWGLNDAGQLGIGTTGGATPRSAFPLTVGGPGRGLDAGGDHTCAYTPTGTVSCWGSASFGELGLGSSTATSTPVKVANLDSSFGSAAENAISLGLGFDHSCAALESGRTKCWGRNDHGQLGRNVTGATLPQSATPDSVFNVTTAAQVASGSAHSCVLLQDGTVRCWGSNAFFAIGSIAPGNFIAPATVPGITGATRIAAGLNHNCAITAGFVRCWGRGDEGQLGDGNFTNSATPVIVAGISTATSISLGDAHSCARLAGGTVRCWGRNVEGQLGNSSNTGSPVPVIVSGLNDAAGLTSGSFHNCVTLFTGGVHCWGRGDKGQLGNGFFINISSPVVATGISGAIAIDAGRSHTCAGLSNGRFRCWGDNAFGQLGNAALGSAMAATSVPVVGFNMDTPALAWTSSDPAVATVDMSGHVHAVGLGEATLTQRYDSRTSSLTVRVDPDTDGDGIGDSVDNCLEQPNPDQRDSDGDLYGNVCDADLNNDDAVNFSDLALFRQRFGSSDADADFNGDGSVNFADLALFRQRFGKPPGPSCTHAC